MPVKLVKTSHDFNNNTIEKKRKTMASLDTNSKSNQMINTSVKGISQEETITFCHVEKTID